MTNIQKITWFSRQWAQKVIDRFVDMWILKVKDSSSNYAKTYIYERYQDIF